MSLFISLIISVLIVSVPNSSFAQTYKMSSSLKNQTPVINKMTHSVQRSKPLTHQGPSIKKFSNKKINSSLKRYSLQPSVGISTKTPLEKSSKNPGLLQAPQNKLSSSAISRPFKEEVNPIIPRTSLSNFKPKIHSSLMPSASISSNIPQLKQSVLKGSTNGSWKSLNAFSQRKTLLPFDNNRNNTMSDTSKSADNPSLTL